MAGDPNWKREALDPGSLVDHAATITPPVLPAFGKFDPRAVSTKAEEAIVPELKPAGQPTNISSY